MLDLPVQFVRTPDAPTALQGRLEAAEPVRFGVPLPRGELRSPAARLISPGGGESAAQARVTARWPDGSARWVLIDAVLPPASPVGDGREWTCRLEQGVQTGHSPGSVIADDRGLLAWDGRGSWDFRPTGQARSAQGLSLTWDARAGSGRTFRPAGFRQIERLCGPIVFIERPRPRLRNWPWPWRPAVR